MRVVVGAPRGVQGHGEFMAPVGDPQWHEAKAGIFGDDRDPLRCDERLGCLLYTSDAADDTASV